MSIDLIYARPGQPANSWKTELTDALSLGAPHLSLYELTIEERTAFGQRARRGEIVPMPDDDQADLYELTQEVCDAEGLPAYEVSNHASSDAYRSRHNLTYWRGGDWLGIGPGAHGRLTVDGERIATHAALRPGDYQTATDSAPIRSAGDTLSALQNARELIALGLRSHEGFDLARTATLTSSPINENALTDFETAGLVRRNGEVVTLTPEGRLLADRIAAELSP
jgi:oxygen-independent coproporphyrinogen-3 oxidase